MDKINQVTGKSFLTKLNKPAIKIADVIKSAAG